MKTYYKVISFLGILFLFTQVLSANWIQKENKNSFVQQERGSLNTEQPEGIKTTKPDSLPKGFTDEVMKDLRNENGNKIFSVMTLLI